MYVIVIVLSFVFWTGERHLILGTAKKGIWTLKYGFKNLLLWKRSSAFVSTEDEILWIHSRLTWFDTPRPPEVSL